MCIRDGTNGMRLAALPGKGGDGNTVTAASGTQTRRGALATTDNLRRFLVGPMDCEITGLAYTPDYQTLFINVQHPGEGGTLANPISAWPASQSGAAAGRRPRSATVVVTRKAGGPIGTA